MTYFCRRTVFDFLCVLWSTIVNITFYLTKVKGWGRLNEIATSASLSVPLFLPLTSMNLLQISCYVRKVKREREANGGVHLD